MKVLIEEYIFTFDSVRLVYEWKSLFTKRKELLVINLYFWIALKNWYRALDA